MSYEEKKFLEQKRIALPLARHLQFSGILVAWLGMGFSILAAVDGDLPKRQRIVIHSTALVGVALIGTGYYLRRYYQDTLTLY